MDRYIHAVIGFFLEFYRTRGRCKQGVILAHADIGTRVNARTALTDNDVARNHSFAAELLNAKAATVLVAPVAG